MNYKIIFLIFVLLLFSCGPQSVFKKQNKETYRIIEKANYGPRVLFHKTIPFENLPFKNSFSYAHLNQNNVKNNSLTERNRYINFDTIFSRSQQKKIDSSLKNLNSVKLKKSLFTNPKILSKEQSEYGTSKEKQVGYATITYPFIINSQNGGKYSFIYRSDGILYVYKKRAESWEEFAKLEIAIID